MSPIVIPIILIVLLIIIGVVAAIYSQQKNSSTPTPTTPTPTTPTPTTPTPTTPTPTTPTPTTPTPPGTTPPGTTPPGTTPPGTTPPGTTPPGTTPPGTTPPGTTPPGTTPPVSPVNFCYRYAGAPMRTLFYKSDDCTPKWGWGYDDPNVGSGGSIQGYTQKIDGTDKFCYRYAGNPMRTLFYKSDDCTSKWGWGFDDPNVGSGGEVYFRTTNAPYHDKYCYRYAGNPMRTLIYKSDDCTANWGWGFDDPNVGSGGEIYVNTAGL